MGSHIKFGYLDLSEITNAELYDLQAKVAEELNARRRLKYMELIKEFKDSFLDANDEFIIQFHDFERGDFTIEFSNLSFIDRETGKIIKID